MLTAELEIGVQILATTALEFLERR